MFRDANLKLLDERSPGGRTFLEGGQDVRDSEVLKAQSGDWTLRYDHRLIHSSVDPVREGRRFADQSKLSGADIVFLYGFGFGYHVQSILDRMGPAGRLFVMELNAGILDLACSHRDLTGIFSDPRVSLLLGASRNETLRALKAVLGLMEARGGRILFHPPSFLSIPDTFKDIKNVFELLRMERRTGGKFASVEEKNFERNRPAALRSRGISELFGKYRGEPGILVGAGPSLDLALPSLEQVRGHILATDTAFQILIDAGIHPGFVISIDPQSYSLEHFKGYFDQDAFLLFSPASCPEVVRRYRGERFVFVLSSQKRYLKNDGEALQRKGETPEGGSVSCAALDLMIRLGFNPIILFGQDCCFSLNRCYASNGDRDKAWRKITGYTAIRDSHQEAIHARELVQAADRFGGRVPVHRNLYSYRGYIEQIVQRNPGTKFLNFHSMGLPLQGVRDIFSVGEICAS